jgi:polyisoprenoid-binding protein YceI
MIDPREFIKVTTYQEVIDGNLRIRDIYTDITFDFSLVVAFSHGVDQSGQIRADVTEITLNNGLSLRIRISYAEFKLLMS